ncbi:MAG: glutamate mutase L, partial [Dehalococcoidia bacterium]|nr:glutamate mutase L [Dehalococcoidia bacterium]
FRLPVIFAGNVDARQVVQEALAQKTAMHVVENIRPTLDRENLMPARMRIQDLFMEHVMQQAPGYDQLVEWAHAPIMPTPAAVGNMMQIVARNEGINLLGVDIGGATTDVFSVFSGTFNRTVSANLGMSYSISNVLVEAGEENILRWLAIGIDRRELVNRIKNKMIRPTTIPQTLEALRVEQAIAREALRLAFAQHKSLAVGLKGVRQQRTIDQAFDQTLSGETVVDMMSLDLIVGSGGVLSHAPRRQQAALMLVDAFQPEGVTRLAVDSIFMMPQLGVLASVHEKAAMDVFWRDCLIPLGTCIAPVGQGKPGAECVTVEWQGNDVAVAFGEMVRLELPEGQRAELVMRPARGFDVGEGPGKPVSADVTGGVVGVIVDARGRPLAVPQDQTLRQAAIARWEQALDTYPQ